MKWGWIAVIVIMVMLVGSASGYSYNFENPSDMDDWVAWHVPGSGEHPTVTQAARTYSDTFWVTLLSKGPGGFKNTNSYPTTYWAATVNNPTGGNTIIYLFDVSGNQITTPPAFGQFRFGVGASGRMELVRSGTTYYLYDDGVEVVNYTGISTIPYYVAYGNNAGGAFVSSYWDDVVIGSSEERSVIGCPPQTWFIAKDVFEPGFSGLYDVPNNQIYANAMHVSYAADGGTGTVTVTHQATGEVVNTTAVSAYSGVITYNLTTMLFTSGAPYGLYTVQMSGTDAHDTFTYKGIATTGTSVVWDDTEYTDDETATITYSIAETHWVPASYTYKVKVENIDLSDIEEWDIDDRPTSANQTIVIDQADFPNAGYYYTTLYAYDRSSGEEILLDYDTMYANVTWSGDNVDVEGTTYDATTGTALGSCLVTIRQGGVDYPVTSNALDGSYAQGGFGIGLSIGVNASKAGYIGYPVYFTPLAEATYNVDIPLVPTGGAAAGGTWVDVTGGKINIGGHSADTTTYYNQSTDGTALGGLVYFGPYWTAGEGATATLANGTWSDSDTANAAGWYQINNIPAPGTYTLTVSATGYSSVSQSLTIVVDEFNRVDVFLNGEYTLTVRVKDQVSLAPILSSCLVELDDGQTCTTTNGTAVFSGCSYGAYTATCSSSGYYSSATSGICDQDTEATCYLTEIPEAPTPGSGGYGLGYPPHNVKFSVQTMWGAPIDGCSVTAQGTECSVGSWEWLYTLCGINSTATPIANSLMSATTDEEGACDFMMFEAVRYNMTFSKAGEISKSITVYPKDEYYVIIPDDLGSSEWLDAGLDPNTACNATVTTAIVGTDGQITCSYIDSTNTTTGGTIKLCQANTTDPMGAETVLSTYAIPAGCGGAGCSTTFTLPSCAGKSCTVRYAPTSSTFASDKIARDFAVNFPKAVLNPLGLSDNILMLISVFFIAFCGCLFAATSATAGGLICCFLGWILFAIGWLRALGESTAILALSVATVLSVAVLIMSRSKKERYL